MHFYDRQLVTKCLKISGTVHFFYIFIYLFTVFIFTNFLLMCKSFVGLTKKSIPLKIVSYKYWTEKLTSVKRKKLEELLLKIT